MIISHVVIKGEQVRAVVLKSEWYLSTEDLTNLVFDGECSNFIKFSISSDDANKELKKPAFIEVYDVESKEMVRYISIILLSTANKSYIRDKYKINELNLPSQDAEMLNKNELNSPSQDEWMSNKDNVFDVATRFELTCLARKILLGELSTTTAQKTDALLYIIKLMTLNDGYLSVSEILENACVLVDREAKRAMIGGLTRLVVEFVDTNFIGDHKAIVYRTGIVPHFAPHTHSKIRGFLIGQLARMSFKNAIQ